MATDFSKLKGQYGTGVYNQLVDDWTHDTLRKTRNAVLRLCVNADGPGFKQQRAASKLYAGEASKIVFSFPYYMIFVEKGAGRGYGGIKSGLFTRPHGDKGKTNPLSFGKMGTGKRMPKPWFNPIIEAQFPELSEIVNDYHGEKVIINLQRILID